MFSQTGVIQTKTPIEKFPRFSSIPAERICFWTSIVLGVLCTWAGRNSISSDGISYLDLGDAYLRGDWTSAANAYWSPAYPWLLGFANRIVQPSIWWKFPLAHIVNFFIFVFALYCFRYLVRALLQQPEEPSSLEANVQRLPDWALWSIAYGFFLWNSLVLIGMWVVTPDLLLSAWLHLAAGLLIKLRTDVSFSKSCALGAVLALAYMTKAIMFPLAFIVFAIVLFSGRPLGRRLPGILVGGICFLLICAPFIACLSRAKGRLTFGDSGKLAYAWLVSPGAPQVNLQNRPGTTLLHPTRKISEHPPVFEFAEPIGGSYPPWFDPSYWNDGLRPTFSLRSQIRALTSGVTVLLDLIAAQSGWLTGMLIFFFLCGAVTLRGVLRNWALLAVFVAATGSYALILLLPRYVGIFVILAGLAITFGVRLQKTPYSDQLAKYVSAAIVVAMALAVAQPLLRKTYESVSAGHPGERKEPMRAAQGLLELGMRPGDRVAIIGIGITDYWAHLGDFKIVAQMMPGDGGGDEFWASSSACKSSLYHLLAQTGARAFVTSDSFVPTASSGWVQIPGSAYHAYLLGPAESDHATGVGNSKMCTSGK